MINSLEEAHAIEAERERAERRQHAHESPGEEDDREVAVADRVAALRRALDELEQEAGHEALAARERRSR